MHEAARPDPGVQIASGRARGARVVIRGRTSSELEPLSSWTGSTCAEPDLTRPTSRHPLPGPSAAAQYGRRPTEWCDHHQAGRSGDNRFGLLSYYRLPDRANKIDLADAQQWAEINRQAYLNAGRAVPQGTLDVLSGARTIDTDWQDAVLRGGAIQDHNLQASGGTPTASYLLSGGYFNQEGVVISSGFERYSFRVNSELRRGRVTLGENLALARSNRQLPIGNQLIDALRFPPSIPVRDSTTISGFGIGTNAVPTFGVNPVGSAELRKQRDRSPRLAPCYGELGLLSWAYRLNMGGNTGPQVREFPKPYPVRQTNDNPAALSTSRTTVVAPRGEPLPSPDVGRTR